MLVLPPNTTNIANIVGIDPGTETLGFSILSFDICSGEIVKTDAVTFVGSKLPYQNDWLIETHGARTSRIMAHCQNISNLLHYYQPLLIASEAPYYSRLHPNAYGALLEIILAVKQLVFQYDPFKQVEMIDPSSVKNAVGVGGRCKKEPVAEAVRGLNGILKIPADRLWRLDEHSIDAIAVAYARYQILKGYL